jgi:hypothetical protein
MLAEFVANLVKIGLIVGEVVPPGLGMERGEEENREPGQYQEEAKILLGKFHAKPSVLVIAARRDLFFT